MPDARHAEPDQTPMPAGEVTSVAVSRRGHIIATGGADSYVKLWDFRTGAALGSFEGHTAAVTKLELR